MQGGLPAARHFAGGSVRASACFSAWVAGLRDGDPDIVAINGKTSRRARRAEESPLHTVSAWASRQRLVLGQEAVAAKSNEITAIPALLERLELKGALVTIDAMGCQRSIAEAIRAKDADYLLALKDNWPTLADDVRLFFHQEPGDAFDRHETTDGDHGRIEIRRHAVSHDVAWLTTTPRFPGEPRFPGLAMIGMIEADAIACRQRRCPPLSSPEPSAPTGASKTASTGSSTSSSTTTSCA